MKTFQSTPITFVDQTDSRKLEVYLKSNLPTAQIYNPNTTTFTPDWTEGECLQLHADVFLDSRIMEAIAYKDPTLTITWFKNSTRMSSNSIEEISSDKRTLTVKSNVLKNDAIITYSCEVAYQGITASARVVFTRVDMGLNGQKGNDGTGVTILGSYDTLNQLQTAHPSGKAGDAYIVDGDLYVWATDDKQWSNVGNIQGPQGKDGKTLSLIGNSQVFHVNSDQTTFLPTQITIAPHFANITEDEKTSATWEYKTDYDAAWHGLTSNTLLDHGITLSNNIVTISGNKFIKSSILSISFKISLGYLEDTLTIYKAFDGTKGDTGDDAPIAFLSNEQVSFVADEDGFTYGGTQSFSTNVVAYVGTKKVVPEIGDLAPVNAKLPSGMSVVADKELNNNEVVLHLSVNDKSTLGSVLSNNGIINIPVSYPIKASLQLSWSKINTGHTGVGIDSMNVTYGKSTSSATMPISWLSTAEAVAASEGEYLWTKTTTNYTSASKPSTVTYAYVKQGEKGEAVMVSSVHYAKNKSNVNWPKSESEWYSSIVSTNGGEFLWTRTTFSDGKRAYSVAQQGRGIDKITEYYLATSLSSGVTKTTTGWKNSIQTVTATNKYLWNYEVISYTDGTSSSTDPIIIGAYGDRGNIGNGIASIEEWYLATSSASGVTASTAGWKNAMQSLTATNKYLWNYELITYTDGNKVTTNPVIIGVYGDKGDPGNPASLVDVTQSALYFKSTTGSKGPFEPQYIYLYPRFQNSTYSNWQYSRDGGLTWVSVSGANGLSIGTYNSSANALRIDRASTLYTDSITSLSFRCNSTNSSVYDTVSVAKIYDVADLQIGGRNLLLNSTFEGRSNYGVFSFDNGEMILSNSSLGSVDNSYVTYTIPLSVQPNDFRGKTLTFSMDYMVTEDITYGTTSPWVGVEFAVVRNSTTGGSSQWFQWFGVKSMPTAKMDKWERKTLHWDVSDYDIERVLFTVLLRDATGTVKFRNPKFEFGNAATDYTPAPEDLIEEAANVNVMLSNEAHFFEATAGGVPVDTSVTLDVVGYKGSVKSATTVGTIIGVPSAGMKVTIANNGTTNTKLTVAITSALTSDIADYGILTIPIMVNGHTINKIFNWTKAKAGDVGASGSDAVTFQVYSNNGYALSTSIPTVTLQAFAYVGDVEIKSGATYQWYRYNNTDWVAVSGATNNYFTVARDDVAFSNTYMCKMQFNNAEYVDVATIEDKNDENKVFASKPFNYFAGDLWVVGTDYIPPSYDIGTMLRAEHTNTGYADSDWVPATKYDKEIKELKNTVDSYHQYFSVNSANGLQIGNSSINNDILTISRVNAQTVNTNSATAESLNVVGKYSGSTMLQAPVINLGNFSIVIESNGSFSIVANT